MAFFIPLDPFVILFVWFLGLVALVVIGVTHRSSPIPVLLFVLFWTGIVVKYAGFG